MQNRIANGQKYTATIINIQINHYMWKKRPFYWHKGPDGQIRNRHSKNFNHHSKFLATSLLGASIDFESNVIWGHKWGISKGLSKGPDRLLAHTCMCAGWAIVILLSVLSIYLFAFCEQIEYIHAWADFDEKTCGRQKCIWAGTRNY